MPAATSVPTTSPSARDSFPRAAFAVAVVLALGFALFTHHAWEDYWITYRASKNLATGHGLVFNVGDRLHTFTSPIGVLLPALASLLTFNASDDAALWIFRVMCAVALGAAAALLALTAKQLRYGRVATYVLVALLVTDAKVLDYTINGMETAFMLLFLAYAFWAHLHVTSRQWLHLGAAWAGLMWTRPDSFVYIGIIAAGFLLFRDSRSPTVSRREQLVVFVRAGLLTTALYAPWLVIAQLYYGTAVPHTVAAKSGLGAAHTLTGFLTTVVQLPFGLPADGSTLTRAFLPAYFMIGGWPPVLLRLAWLVGTVCSVLWLVPRLRIETRAASLAFFGGHAYLTYFPSYAYPWYLPSTTLLAFLALSGLVQQAAERVWSRRIATGVAVAGLCVASWTTWQVARQVAAQQRLVEDGNRRRIGEWLRTVASPGQTVFMEPLGYIGYYSGLKTFDFPGMSSREMVAARRQFGNDWAVLIRHLHPDWLVLRPGEITRIEARDPALLQQGYARAREFSVADQVAALRVYGRLALMSDSRYTVFRAARR